MADINPKCGKKALGVIENLHGEDLEYRTLRRLRVTNIRTHAHRYVGE